MDPFGRTIDYLRISVTDRCNERCLYCMPEGYTGWAQRADHLTADEIVRIVEATTGLGFRKFRLTGGEPLVRPDLVEIARRIWDLPGVETLGLSTNGLGLAELAAPLKQAGVRSVNVSLDALDPALYRRLTGGSLDRVLEGIHAAIRNGFERVKLNCVLLRGMNESEIMPLLQFGAQHDLPVRFIELMPMSPVGPITTDHFLGVDEVMRRLMESDELRPAQDERMGHGPARYYRLHRLGTLVGFIGARTCADFCERCNKMRLTADGRIRPCLGDHAEVDLKPALRQDAETLEAVFQRALASKPERHAFAEGFQPQRPMTAVGGGSGVHPTRHHGPFLCPGALCRRDGTGVPCCAA